MGGDEATNDVVAYRYDGVEWSEVFRSPVEQLSSVHWPEKVWVSGNGEVFAISQDYLLHYDGTTWTTRTATDLGATREGGSPLVLQDIWGSSATDVFVVGDRFSEPYVLHFDGSDWTAQFFDRGSSSVVAPPLVSVWGFSGGEVFAATDDAFADSGTCNVVLAYDGSQWHGASAPCVARLGYLDVHGVPSSDVFLFSQGGRNPFGHGGGFILHGQP